ncbi:hypothetical protein PsalN5692_00544 [Piscirickettsia salmonis]|nr:hypothetical protein PsalN5692_00544 [Piscirickettsia salmonis]
MDDTERYAYGHSAKGKRCYAEKPGSKSIRINFMGGLRGKQFIAPMVVEGYCNNNVCQAYIDQCLIPCLSPGETVIMDNDSFHKSKGVKEAIEGTVAKNYSEFQKGYFLVLATLELSS